VYDNLSNYKIYNMLKLENKCKHGSNNIQKVCIFEECEINPFICG
jgi:hypothetical protein